MSKKSSTFAAQFRNELIISRSRAVVARQAHNLKVGGSIPPSATREKPLDSGFFIVCNLSQALYTIDDYPSHHTNLLGTRYTIDHL